MPAPVSRSVRSQMHDRMYERVYPMLAMSVWDRVDHLVEGRLARRVWMLVRVPLTTGNRPGGLITGPMSPRLT